MEGGGGKWSVCGSEQDRLGRSLRVDLHASFLGKPANSPRGGWVFILLWLEAKKRDRLPGKNMHGICGKEKYWRGGRGYRAGDGSSWSEDCGMVLLCAFQGIRVQKGAWKIASGMSGLEKCLAGGA